ncbi:G-protein alpha subunit [Mycena venus]|uniref:G-protein alpha subunit n=1 Tax=Mycena venus TaxID=2733690 RepID=A0A8H6TYZ0_9AGAR|nr:G-protein alpha subunit [Mycena venus]
MPPHPVSGGGFSDIYQGELDTEVVCIKVLRIFTTELRLDKIYKELAREVLIWKELSHPNVLPLLGIDLIARKPSCCLVSPWMKNGNVMAFLETHPNFSKSSLVNYHPFLLGKWCSKIILQVRDIASGLKYLHDLDPPVVHGDIKGANILIDDGGQACLADFGLALAVESQAFDTSAGNRGTLRWLAPEILDSSRKAERQASLTKRDIYAFGCTILEVYLCLRMPTCQSESGKSSVLLNLRQALTPKYFERERLVWKTVIQLNLISLIKIILVVLQHEWEALETDSVESTHATPLTAEHRRLALSLSPLIAFETSISQMIDRTTGGYETSNDPSPVAQVLAACKNEIIALFEDVFVRGVLESLGFDLQNDSGFFLDDTARIAALDYVPTNRDIVRTRKRTAGVEEYRFVTEGGITGKAGTEFHITEVCGSSSQRSTWIPYLDNVQVILFLAPLDFWQSLDEDPKVNRVQESLELWREIVGNRLLAKTTLILLINKKDVLRKHIDAGMKVNKYVPSYGDRAKRRGFGDKMHTSETSSQSTM